LVLAAVLEAGPGAVASHLSAAALWRFEGIGRGPVEVIVRAGRHPAPDHGTIHRSRDLVATDIEPRARTPVTTAARTLFDIAPRVEETRLEAVLDHAERRGIVWRPHLRWRLRELARQGRPGVPAVRRLLDRTEGRGLGDSWLEQEGLRLIAQARLPMPRCQVELRKAGGGIARVDLFWEEARLVVELDGHGTHATRRDRQAAAERAARLGIEGWHVVSFTYEDVTERPGYVVAMIRTYLGSAAA
jgi:acyl-coenzyme A thioesterase PaaI-like protein